MTKNTKIWALCLLLWIVAHPMVQQSQNVTRTDHPGDDVLSEAQSFFEKAEYERAMAGALQAAGLLEPEKKWERWAAAMELAYKSARKSGSPEVQRRLIPAFRYADTLITRENEAPRSVKVQIYAQTGYLHHLLGAYDEALEAYEKGLPPAVAAQDTAAQLRMFGSAAILYWTRGDDFKALEYHERALALAEATSDTAMIAAICTNVANVYRGLKDIKCVAFYQRALSLQPEQSEAAMLLSKAHIELTGDMAQAMSWANQALRYASYPDERADATHQVGRVWAAQNQHQKALPYYRRALQLAHEGYGEGHPEAEKIHVFTARSLCVLGSHEASVAACNAALRALLPLFQPKDGPHINPEDAAFTIYNLWVLEALLAKAEAYQAWFGSSRDYQHLQHALACSETALLYLQKIRLRYGEDASKHEVNAYVRPACESALQAAFALHGQTGDQSYLKRAFSLTEKIKATTLSEALFHKRIQSVAGVPDEVIAKERYLYGRIAYWTKLLHESDTLGVAKDSLFWTKQHLAHLERDIQAHFPRYARELTAYKGEVSADSVAAHLPEDAALIAYFMGEKSLYTFLISQKGFWANERPLPERFTERLLQFRKATSDWTMVNEASAVCDSIFWTDGYALFETLLDFPLQHAIQQRLFIVPDGLLYYLPFETLPTSAYAGSWIDRDAPMLLKNKTVSYRFSARTLHPVRYQGSWGGWGLDYDGISNSERGKGLRGLGELPYATREVASVSNLLGGIFWLNEEATREHFLQNAHQFGVLHLAMHGVIDEQDPLRSRLLFTESVAGSDPFVYASDLYHLQLNAGLAVLSACHSGSGALVNGEGVMSLSRAFAFAGCPSMVMSLWGVSDQSTEQLMLAFYRFLKEGKTKDEALRLAKLAYLSESSSEYAKPIFWSGFVPVGEMDAFPPGFFDPPWYAQWKYLAGLFILIWPAVFWWRRRKKKTQ